jgi:hypothetical protein
MDDCQFPRASTPHDTPSFCRCQRIFSAISELGKAAVLRIGQRRAVEKARGLRTGHGIEHRDCGHLAVGSIAACDHDVLIVAGLRVINMATSDTPPSPYDSVYATVPLNSPAHARLFASVHDTVSCLSPLIPAFLEPFPPLGNSEPVGPSGWFDRHAEFIGTDERGRSFFFQKELRPLLVLRSFKEPDRSTLQDVFEWLFIFSLRSPCLQPWHTDS